MMRLLKWFGVGLGVLVVFVFVNVLWFVTGKPTVSVNYVEQLNDLVRPAGAVEEENAAALLLEATDLLTTGNEQLREYLFDTAWKGHTHHEFSKLSTEDQETVNQWVEQYYEPDFALYQDLIDQANRIIQLNNLSYFSSAVDPKFMLFLQDLFLQIYFPGFSIGPEYYDEDLFGFGWQISEKIINYSFDPGWNKAIAALLIIEWKKQNELEYKEITKWLAENELAWRKLEEGCERRYFWYEYDESGTMEDAVGSNLGGIRAMIKMGVLKARLALDEGKTKEAFNIYTSMFRVSRLMMEPHNDTTTSLVALAFMDYVPDNMLECLSTETFDMADLEQVQKEMKEIIQGEYPYIRFDADRLQFLDIVQRAFTDGGIGGGHIVPGALEAAVGEEPGVLFDFKYSFGFFECWKHAGRNDTVAEADKLYAHLNNISEVNLYERRKEKISIDDKLANLPVEDYMLVHMYLNYTKRYNILDYRSKAKYEAVVTVLALKRWELEKGAYPEGLGELVVGGYLREAPDDPYGPGELSYRREGEDFVLYSWGADFDDDGGVHDIYWGEGVDGGDFVFGPMDR